MKRSELLAYAVALACVVFVSLTYCESKRNAAHQREVSVSMEREVSVDTAVVAEPVAVTAGVVEQRAVRLPRARSTGASEASEVSEFADSTAADSVDVVLPIERKVYADSNYRAVVSGYDVSLDTIEVYTRHETTTYRHFVQGKPKRWGIGIVAGYGVTPHGLQPFAGVAVSYTIFSF